ncbi:MAG: hypothetical protein LH609_00100 [Rudanella sp.]|nr:hypothetical protein [Rudanella sp.]
MKHSLVLILVLVTALSCRNIVDLGSTLTLIAKNESNHSVLVDFFPKPGTGKGLDDINLLPNSQQERVMRLEAGIVFPSSNFTFVSYGEMDSIRVVFDNQRYLSFSMPTNASECTIPYNIFCADKQTCTKSSEQKGQCVYVITEAMYRVAKKL